MGPGLSRAPSVAVFASSAADVDQSYRDLADELGTRIGARNWTLVYGGTLTGMMRSVADSCRAVGGTVVAVTLRQFEDLGIVDDDAHDLVVTATLAERKHHLLERADAFVVLPGGFGTLDEAIEVLAWRRLGLLDKPLVFLDHAGFWTPLLGQVEVMVREGMLGIGASAASSGSGAGPDDDPDAGHAVAAHGHATRPRRAMHLGYDVAADPGAVEACLARHFAPDV